MRLTSRILALALLVLGLVAGGAGATHPAAKHKNMNNLFFSPTGATNSDLAFWGDRAYVGNYGGFRIFDVSNPASPTCWWISPASGLRTTSRCGTGTGTVRAISW